MKTIQEAVEYCAEIAYNDYMGGAMSTWARVPIQEMAWVYGMKPSKFSEMCAAAFKAKFKK